MRVTVVGSLEALPEAAAERAIVDGEVDLEQPIGAPPPPAQLLRFVHPAVHQEIGRALDQRYLYLNGETGLNLPFQPRTLNLARIMRRVVLPRTKAREMAELRILLQKTPKNWRP